MLFIVALSQTLPELPDKAKAVHVDGFEPAAAFAGARSGFVFKAGVAGLGYYPDSKSGQSS